MKKIILSVLILATLAFIDFNGIDMLQNSAFAEEKRLVATLNNRTITIEPFRITFIIPEEWIKWHEKYASPPLGYGNNLNLTREELTKIEFGGREWDTEYAQVINAVLPFGKCVAHLGEESFGHGYDTGDLQMRVYVVNQIPKDIEAIIDSVGVSTAEEINKKCRMHFVRAENILERTLTKGWYKSVLSYGLFYDDYGGVAYVDFRMKSFDANTLILVFMYADYTNQEKIIDDILSSVSFYN